MPASRQRTHAPGRALGAWGTRGALCPEDDLQHRVELLVVNVTALIQVSLLEQGLDVDLHRVDTERLLQPQQQLPQVQHGVVVHVELPKQLAHLKVILGPRHYASYVFRDLGLQLLPLDKPLLELLPLGLELGGLYKGAKVDLLHVLWLHLHARDGGEAREDHSPVVQLLHANVQEVPVREGNDVMHVRALAPVKLFGKVLKPDGPQEVVYLHLHLVLVRVDNLLRHPLLEQRVYLNTSLGVPQQVGRVALRVPVQSGLQGHPTALEKVNDVILFVGTPSFRELAGEAKLVHPVVQHPGVSL
mmetsp:Transcript_427/g.938  ORF Transcript_427/g.938 Transcript_427/m.938 type:complete len:302 (-) Transcript_427:1155-2060(-)